SEMNRTVLYNVQRDHGAHFTDVGGWEIPVDYGDCLIEHKAVRESIGLLERRSRGFLVITGPDRYSWLQGMVSNDVRPLEAGAPPLWEKLVDEGIQPVGESAADTLRIEAGIPEYGRDMDETTIPLECNLEATHISHTKGCYVGQEIIARIHSRGHTNRALTGLLIEGAALPIRGDKVYPTEGETDREVGWVTSATHSPSLERSIA